VESESRAKVLVYWRDANGTEPCLRWLNGLRDAKGRAVIRVKLNRLEQGNSGHCASVGEGVHELKVDFGPGYRIYFGNDGNRIVLLCGGDKGTQASDIKKAKERWSDYNA
jgi:putative addiction module killer protein